MGRRTRKKIKPVANNQNWLFKGFSNEESSAASITNPSNKTADTSITPVRIDMTPDNIKTQKLPERAHRKNPSTLLGGGPFAGAL